MTNMEGFLVACIYMAVIFGPLVVLAFIFEVIVPHLPAPIKDFISGILYRFLK